MKEIVFGRSDFEIDSELWNIVVTTTSCSFVEKHSESPAVSNLTMLPPPQAHISCSGSALDVESTCPARSSINRDVQPVEAQFRAQFRFNIGSTKNSSAKSFKPLRKWQVDPKRWLGPELLSQHLTAKRLNSYYVKDLARRLHSILIVTVLDVLVCLSPLSGHQRSQRSQRSIIVYLKAWKTPSNSPLFTSQASSEIQALALPQMISPYLARVKATFNLRGSFKKPMPWFLDSTLPSKSSNVQQKTYQQDSAGCSNVTTWHRMRTALIWPHAGQENKVLQVTDTLSSTPGTSKVIYLDHFRSF